MNFPIFERNIKQKMLKTIIVDDEEHVRGTLRKFLEKYCPQVKIVNEAGSVSEAHEIINRHNPDLVLKAYHKYQSCRKSVILDEYLKTDPPCALAQSLRV